MSQTMSMRQALFKVGQGTMDHFLLPVRALRQYRLHDLPHDLLAGLTVSVVDLPQSMAFALIAGVNPIYGIYTAIVQALFGGLFTSSAFLANGPTNTQSLLVAAIVTRLADRGSAYYLTLVIALTFIKGIIQLAFAAARMGNLVRYVSDSVMIGFTAGAGVLIIVGQIPNFLGLHVTHGGDQLPAMIGSVQRIWPLLGQINPYAAGVGVGCLIALVVLRRISRFIPEALIAVAASAALVWAGGWYRAAGVTVVGQIGDFPSGLASLPHFALPHVTLSMIQALMGGAVALALLGMLESVSIAKSIAIRSGDRIDANQEFFGQGISNLIAGFFVCMPGSASFTRTALQYDAGARTRLCSVVTALCNAGMIVALAAAAWYIPLAALAAILFVVAATLVDHKRIRRIIHSSPSDAVVCIFTFILVLTVPLTYAIYIGIFLNIALYLRRAGQLHVAEMVQSQAGPFVERPVRMREGVRPVVFLQIEGDLFFAVADELRDQLTRVIANGGRVVVLRLKRTHWIDFTVLNALEQIAKQLRKHDGHLLLCGVKPELNQRLRRFGLVRLLGEDHVFESGYGVFSSAKQALHKARELAGDSAGSTDLLGAEDETEAWGYNI